ncbi:hypothetical protein ACFVDH_24465, partial [Streptomyces sp. NPDC057674]|uniref:hypothetical protein n=1 Tax=Streptomyces sp. NPDC057674 TaxID=3346203 RepID=UPI0036CC8E66
GYYAPNPNEGEKPLGELLVGNAPVCALGACARAHYELTGQILADDDIYEGYSFETEWTFAPGHPSRPVPGRAHDSAGGDPQRQRPGNTSA